MKKAVIISCFGWYTERLIYIEEVLKQKGFSVTIYNSDFLHFKKERVVKSNNCNYVHVPSYKKNLSLARLYSHAVFSYRIFLILKEYKPDFVYALVPPNSVVKACSKYKKLNRNIFLVYDIIDMWPESYTGVKLLQYPFKKWRDLRDKNLAFADHVFTECDLYKSFISTKIKLISTLYLCREEVLPYTPKEWDGHNLDVAYLGSINNIIDIPLISQLLFSLSKQLKVTFHIVGGGESKELLVNLVKTNGVQVVDHGVIFDKPQMREIISRCHFAVNMMKKNVCVGLTIKSMDYFQIGVPLFNTIKADTTDIVEKYHCGFNVNNVQETADQIMSLDSESYRKMRENVHKVFLEMFTVDVFKQEFEKTCLIN